MRTKIFLSIIIAVAASSCFTLSSTQAISNDIPQKQGIIVSGETEGTVAIINDTFENVIESFGDNAVIYSPKKGYADVITETGEHRTFIQQKMYTLVSMKSGIEPPVEEINEKIGCSENYRIKFFRPPYSDVYSFYIPEDVDKNLVYDILKNDENVMTVEECLNVSEIYCTLENIFINSQLTDTELIEMYPELNLKKSETDFTEYYPEYNHYFDYDTVHTDVRTKETYNAFKRLSDSGDSYHLLGTTPEDANDVIYASSKTIVYQAEEKSESIITGDVNADGKIDLTDLSELSLAIIGDKTLTEAQLKAADIDDNSKADLPDLARLRQYLSKVVTSLR